ncbi:hypothetical protein ACFWR9_11665 [Streptomyces sp. NPDC058534]|uniref:hypothetical protein n=1 Tax=Streptomyces sp. NPDC058534 TaxID=3346541 RepID=UPI00365C6260
MKPTAPRKPGVKMTLHVYRVNQAGAVTEDRGTVNVGSRKKLPPKNDAYPPCTCPRHRAERAATR